MLDGEAVVLGVDGVSDVNALHSREPAQCRPLDQRAPFIGEAPLKSVRLAHAPAEISRKRPAETPLYGLRKPVQQKLLGPVDKPNPDPNGCKDDKGHEALNEFIVAGCDAS